MSVLKAFIALPDGEPLFRADVHWTRPRVAATRRPGTAAHCRARRLPQHGGRALHPAHAASAHRAARISLATARLRSTLLLPLFEIIK